MIAEYLQQRRNIAQIFVLIDSRLTPQKLDIEFINSLYELQKPFSLIYTKSDKVSQKEVSATCKMMMKELSKIMDYIPTYYITSAEKRQSTANLIQSIHDINISY